MRILLVLTILVINSLMSLDVAAVETVRLKCFSEGAGGFLDAERNYQISALLSQSSSKVKGFSALSSRFSVHGRLKLSVMEADFADSEHNRHPLQTQQFEVSGNYEFIEPGLLKAYEDEEESKFHPKANLLKVYTKLTLQSLGDDLVLQHKDDLSFLILKKAKIYLFCRVFNIYPGSEIESLSY